MKKTIRLTESELTKLIRKVITESEYQKMDVLKYNINKTANSDCWKKGMCPKVTGGDVSQTECEFCIGPIAGLLIPAVGAIAGAIMGIKNNRERKMREQQEQKWIQENPELNGRKFIYYTDGSIQAMKVGRVNDILIKPKDGSWTKLK
jgi:hypothetical protein